MNDLKDPAGYKEMATLSARLETLHSDVSDIKSALKDLTTAITKLALIEERVAITANALERAFKTISKIDERVTTLELKAPLNERSNAWLDRLVMTIVGAALALVWDQVTK